jgi:hypothetical protein
MDMIGRNEEIPIGGGARFGGLEVQTAESNSNASTMAFSRVPDITAVVEQANAGIGLDLKKRYDNNSSNSAAAQRSGGRSCSAACRRWDSSPDCIRTITRSTTGPKRSTT